MGKARITENLGSGQYRITRIFSNARGNDTDGDTITAWCADYVDDLEVGDVVGTVEVGGTGKEFRDGMESDVYLIAPSFASEAWEKPDGRLMEAEDMTPALFFRAAALRQGWQRWKPTSRTGKILSINYDTDTADVCLRPAADPVNNMLLEPDDLPECDLGEEMPENDFHIQQAQDFCERHPSHPMCQEFEARTQVSYDTWWATIVSVNTQVNTNVTYARDVGGDVWDVATSGTGDCEDYALGKMQLLAAAGVPASAMGLAIGKLGSGPVRGTRDVDHAWAVVFTDKGLFHLDQAPNVPLGTQPGSNFQILRYNRYEILARKLTGVPIEYMDCNSAPFVEGDDVVVKFDDQDWSKPKIIGFVEEPQPCKTFLIRVDWGNHSVVWDTIKDAPLEFEGVTWPIDRRTFTTSHPWVPEGINFDEWWFNIPFGFGKDFDISDNANRYMEDWGEESMLTAPVKRGEFLTEPGAITVSVIEEDIFFNFARTMNRTGDDHNGTTHFIENSSAKRISRPIFTSSSEYHEQTCNEKITWSYLRRYVTHDTDMHTAWGTSPPSIDWEYTSVSGYRIYTDTNEYCIPILEKNEIEYTVKSVTRTRSQTPYIATMQTYEWNETRTHEGPELKRATIGGPYYTDYPMSISLISDSEKKNARQCSFLTIGLPWAKPYDDEYWHGSGYTVAQRSEDHPADFYCFFSEFKNTEGHEYVTIQNGEDEVDVPIDWNPFDLSKKKRLTSLENFLRSTVGASNQEGTLYHGTSSWDGALYSYVAVAR